MPGTPSYRRRAIAPVIAAACVFVLLALASPALAYNEGGTTDPGLLNCICHPVSGNGFRQGPHSDYSTTSTNCSICHSVHPKIHHVASGEPTGTYGIMLLPKQTIKATCETCHDGTGGAGVYGTIAARGLVPGAQHRIDTTNVVPGGDAATGGSAVTTFSGVGDDLSCDDCHDPHDGGTVNAFFSSRVRGSNLFGYSVLSTSLLKRKPTGAATSTADYGSDWCGACHKGRLSGAGAHNHPVDSKQTTSTPFTYAHAAILATNGPTAQTVLSYMGGVQSELGAANPNGGGSRGFLMPLPGGVRTAQQRGHYPICQQCHDNSSNVGTLAPDGSTAQATTQTVSTADGTTASNNPRFQNFPHETVNTRMLVENGDDLCTNCHPPSILP
jgi:hypothetical protein